MFAVTISTVIVLPAKPEAETLPVNTASDTAIFLIINPFAIKLP